MLGRNSAAAPRFSAAASPRFPFDASPSNYEIFYSYPTRNFLYDSVTVRKSRLRRIALGRLVSVWSRIRPIASKRKAALATPPPRTLTDAPDRGVATLRSGIRFDIAVWGTSTRGWCPTGNIAVVSIRPPDDGFTEVPRPPSRSDSRPSTRFGSSPNSLSNFRPKIRDGRSRGYSTSRSLGNSPVAISRSISS